MKQRELALATLLDLTLMSHAGTCVVFYKYTYFHCTLWYIHIVFVWYSVVYLYTYFRGTGWYIRIFMYMNIRIFISYLCGTLWYIHIMQIALQSHSYVTFDTCVMFYE